MSDPQIATCKAHKRPNGDTTAARDERTQRESDLVETERQKVCEGEIKTGGRRQVRGKEKAACRVIHCVLVLRTVSDTMYDI